MTCWPVLLVLTPLSTIFQLWCITWWPVLLVFNDTFNNVSGIRTKKICLFTVTRPTLLSVETLVHFIGKSKVKVDTSEIFGLKKLSGYFLKNNRHQFFYYTTATIFLRYYNTFRLESNQIYAKVRYLFPDTDRSAIRNLRMWNKMKIRPTHPIFLEDVTVNRHIFLFGLTYDMLASFIGINATVNNISAMMYNMALSFIGV